MEHYTHSLLSEKRQRKFESLSKKCPWCCFLLIYWWNFCQVVVVKLSTTGAMVSSSRGASCTQPLKGVFRAQSYIHDEAFARIVKGFKCFRKSSILDIWLGSRYDSTPYPQKSVKMQLLNKLSQFLHKFNSLLFLKNSCFKGCFLR